MMAAALHNNKCSEVKLLRKPLPPRKDRITGTNETKCILRPLSNSNGDKNGREDLDKTAVDERNAGRKWQGRMAVEDLNKPEWVFQKPRGPDPFPLRPARKPFPLNKRMFLDEYLMPMVENSFDNIIERLEPGFSKFGLTLWHGSLASSAPTPTNTITYYTEQLDSRRRYNKKQLLLESDRNPAVSVLDLDLPENVNFQLRKPLQQLLLEEKAKQIFEEDYDDQYFSDYENQNWISYSEPVYAVGYTRTLEEQNLVETQNQTFASEPRRRINNAEGDRQLESQERQTGSHTAETSIYTPHNTRDTSGYVTQSSKGPTAHTNWELHVTSTSDECISSMAQAEEAADQCSAEGGTYLNLKAYSLDTLPDVTSLLTTLISVNLAFNNFTQIPEELMYAKQLEALQLRNNPISEISNKIKKFKKLKILGLSFCCITELPQGFFRLTSLEQLDLSYNEIITLPNDIRFLTSLRELNIEGNQLWALPRGLLSLELKILNCSNNLLHPLLWRENAGPQPQTLSEMCATSLVRSGRHLGDVKLPESVAKIFKSLSLCDYCAEPKFGQGVKLIKPVVEIFGNTNLPIIFFVCSQGCRLELKKATRVAAPIEVVEKGVASRDPLAAK